MSKLEKPYNAGENEQAIYNLWQENNCFAPVSAPQKYVVAMPPPNVTGRLHIGHALGSTIQDILVRFHRLLGEEVLYLPGTDHAGIATQAVVERELAKKGIKRFEMGRENFVQEVWQWKDKYHERIVEQLKVMGVSCDWSREAFTLSEQYNEAVYTAFARMHEKGLIYRGEYLTNWSVKGQTAISDDEVIYEDRPGKLYYIKYPLSHNVDQFIIVATTRPETMLGDSAIVVHPKDHRYKKLVGKLAKLPLVGREIPIISDNAVDKEFGSGAVKVTPAHDKNDWELGQKHRLAVINIINTFGKLNENVPDAYQGLKTSAAREKIANDLDSLNLLEKVEEIKHRVGVSERYGDIVEPIISTQWFVKMKPLAQKAIEAVESGAIKIIPKRFEKIYFHWMNNIHDWCISRQLWWGHRIPVWTKGAQTYVGVKAPQDKNWIQDEDVLDTWFSSALFPFATLGWPNTKSSDYKKYFPTSTLETGYDIIFFWVARMIMMSLELTGKVPFETVYLHGLVRDEKGRKMSKSLGNIVEPVELSRQWGTDALRMALVMGTSPGGDVNFSPTRAKGYRNFANKIWNASRFVLSHVGKEVVPIEVKKLDIHNRGDLAQLNNLISDVTGLLNENNVALAGERLYDWFWHTFADIIIERHKKILLDGKEEERLASRYVLWCILEKCLIMLHPFMPFVTETIWQEIPLGLRKGQKFLVNNKWPS